MYIALGVVAFFVYMAFTVATYEHLHSGIDFEWGILFVSLFWFLVLILVVVMRFVGWLAVGAGKIVAVCYGDF